MWWTFSECGVLAFVLHFSIICCVQLKFPEGRTENQPTGSQRALWSFTSEFWDAAGFSPLNLEVQDKAGHKSHERREGARCRWEKERFLCGCRIQVCIPNQTRPSLPIVEAVLCHWTSTPLLGATSVQMKGNGSRAERASPCPMGSSLYDIV